LKDGKEVTAVMHNSLQTGKYHAFMIFRPFLRFHSASHCLQCKRLY